MNILKTILGLFGTTDKKLIRASGSTTIILYLMHYIFESEAAAICFDKVATAFFILVIYLIFDALISKKFTHKPQPDEGE